MTKLFWKRTYLAIRCSNLRICCDVLHKSGRGGGSRPRKCRQLFYFLSVINYTQYVDAMQHD